MTDKKKTATKPGKAAKAPAIAPFPIVGIGASAGGLAAFEEFFSGMPADADPGMAFVLVQHLAPDHKSALAELIRRYTRMQVFEVEDGRKVEINCAYIIPPNKDMALLHGCLQLMEPAEPRGHRLPIDFFFRSLAQDQRERAIGVVLSGNGHDGTLGVRAIKNEGGMALAQSLHGLEFDGMPRSAIATGLIDQVAAPKEMPALLIAYASHPFSRQQKPAAEPAQDNALKKIMILLRAQTGHDFSLYKPGTTQRRIERRMAVHQLATRDDYLRYAQQTPGEVDALFRDLLIGVTRFFRDPDAFKALAEKVIPKLLAGKSAGAPVRIWSAGCSTGEEAYSLAMLFAESQEPLQQGLQLQVFATDIDGNAISVARAGCYPASIAAEVSPERLARFFTLQPDGTTYRINKSIRDMLVFSEQDVIKDPPFSKLDLICCRNLLIYLGGDLQKRLMQLFHYSLNPGGALFLGSSESVGESTDLYSALDRKLNLYLRKNDLQARRHTRAPFLPLQSGLQDNGLRAPGRKSPSKPPLRELTEQALLSQPAPGSALVNGQGDILYIHGRSGHYLEPAPGEAGVSNILKMARDGLRHPLAAALQRAISKKESVHTPGITIRSDWDSYRANLSVRPVQPQAGAASKTLLYLVTVEEVQEEAKRAAVAKSTPDGAEESPRIAMLRQELQAKQEHLQTTVEELETTNEELMSSNEEMQSVNEELQSTNEEMETSKEELQSVNEELSTVNSELQAKVGELSQANNDMNNLLAGTGIGTVFVDQKLNILRFTPAATQVINLIPNDVGRPVGHIVSNLVGYDSLLEDVREVLQTLVPKEVEVQAKSGAWFLLRIRPYRSRENVFEGAVIVFVDISELKALRRSQRLSAILRDARDALILQDMEGRTLGWNPAAERLYGWTEAQALKMNVRERIPLAERNDALARVKQLGCGEVLESYLARRLTRSGAEVEVRMTATALVNEAGDVYAIATTERLAISEPAQGSTVK